MLRGLGETREKVIGKEARVKRLINGDQRGARKEG